MFCYSNLPSNCYESSVSHTLEFLCILCIQIISLIVSQKKKITSLIFYLESWVLSKLHMHSLKASLAKTKIFHEWWKSVIALTYGTPIILPFLTRQSPSCQPQMSFLVFLLHFVRSVNRNMYHKGSRGQL